MQIKTNIVEKIIKLRSSRFGQKIIYLPKEMVNELDWKKDNELKVVLVDKKLVIEKA
ncbi:MAG: hypothetical protein KJ906_03595 [Nanoarchaeota archaeon]|nr:hypothetical protein [Nanoarchaeota archaeon]